MNEKPSYEPGEWCDLHAVYDCDERGPCRAKVCLTCGHNSPHVQQYGDECFCGCVDYTTASAPSEKSCTRGEFDREACIENADEERP